MSPSEPVRVEREEGLLPDEGFDQAVRELARTLADGPTLAHVATKQVLRDFLEGGVELANDRVDGVAAALFDSEGSANGGALVSG